MKIDSRDFSGMRITVMGLGVHGGGAAAAEYCAAHGGEVTVTDLKDEESLAPSIERLSNLPGLRFVLGRHEDQDFADADMVIKNPAVPRNARHLALARRIETDISIYLSVTRSRIVAVTGTKGKSTTAAATAHLLRRQGARLGGNITVSPLTFVDDEPADSHGPAAAPPVVLELSSFQIGDLALTGVGRGWPTVAILTNFMRDHQDYYGSMEAYRRDKELLFEFQDRRGYKIIDSTTDYASHFASAGVGTMFPISPEPVSRDRASAFLEGGRGYLVDDDGAVHEVVGSEISVPGEHNRMNLLYAACAAWLSGADVESIHGDVGCFAGVPHRMEMVGAAGRSGRTLRFVNDSSATVPEAALAAVRSFSKPVYLICGGADKDLDFSLFPEIAGRSAGCYLLDGSATPRIANLLSDAGCAFSGPFDDLGAAIDAAAAAASEPMSAGSAHTGEAVILLSPGCASFGMFKNEFDRGDRFREIVRRLL